MAARIVATSPSFSARSARNISADAAIQRSVGFQRRCDRPLRVGRSPANSAMTGRISASIGYRFGVGALETGAHLAEPHQTLLDLVGAGVGRAQPR